MSLIGITEIIKTETDITVPAISGKVQRVINTGTNGITVTLSGGETYSVLAGQYCDCFYDEGAWYTERDSFKVTEVADLNNDVDEALVAINRLIEEQAVYQVIQNHITNKWEGTYTADRSNALTVDPFTTSITTKIDNSRVQLDFNIFGETDNDSCWILERSIDNGQNWIEMGQNSDSDIGARFYGIAASPYDDNENSTMENFTISYIDNDLSTPAGTTVTYRLRVYGTNNNRCIINMTKTDSNASVFERCSSNVRLAEISPEEMTQTEVAQKLSELSETVAVTELSDKIDQLASGLHVLRKSISQVYDTENTCGTTWKLIHTFDEILDFKAGSKLKLFYHVPARNKHDGWGGLYIEPQVSFNGGTDWYSLGSSGYDAVMVSGADAIGHYNNMIQIDPEQTSDYSFTIRFYMKSYSSTAYINGDHDLNVMSGTAPLIAGQNGLQHFMHIIVEELAEGIV